MLAGEEMIPRRLAGWDRSLNLPSRTSTTTAEIHQAAHDVPALAALDLDPGFNLQQGDPASPAGCELWDVGRADPVQHQPISAKIPTLVLAGDFDLGVPDFIVRQIPPTLANSFFSTFPASRHIQLGNFNHDSPCARSIAAQSLDSPRRQPDSSCIAALPQFDFTP